MSETGFNAFQMTIEKSTRFLQEIEQVYGWPKERRTQSYAALRAVMHALRDRLTVNEAVQLAAQLPTLLRGVYYDGWAPSKVPMKMSHDDFLARVRQEFPYTLEGGIPRLVETVLQTLSRHITSGEWEHVKSMFPKDLAVAFP